jgi:folate-dependent phosphoribosylglycinamide formyltransferase PurN
MAHPRQFIHFFRKGRRMSRQTPIRVVFLTSIRDIGGDDRNGSVVETQGGQQYMLGVIEHAVRQCHPLGSLHGLMDVAGVITDDLGTEKRLLESYYPVKPTKGMHWIHPLDLQDHYGDRIVDRTFWLPSDFRRLPLMDVEGRSRRKLEYESDVLDIAEGLGANVIVSDHYMCKIVHLHKWLPRAVLNIHPAITWLGHSFCFRGKSPTDDALKMAHTGRLTMTGATLHYVDDQIDDGPIIAVNTQTPVRSDDAKQTLRYRNYRIAKLPTFVAGMRNYIEHHYPDIRAAA